MSKAQMERLGEPGNEFRQMGFSIEKAVVEARGRALKAQYSMELAQDLRAIHGLDAEAELANILSSEILSEINREIVRTVYRTALPGAQNNVALCWCILTWTSTPTVVGLLRSSRVSCSRLREIVTPSPS